MIQETKDSNPNTSLKRICRLLGVSRQAHYQTVRFCEKVSMSQAIVLEQVQAIREDHPALGTRKLYCKLRPFLQEHKIKIGRDALFDLLSSQHLLIRNRKRRVYTTQSYHWLKKYPDLAAGIKLTRPNQLWVSDITYYKISSGNAYISFVTDAYSHKIVGYNISDNLEAAGCIAALQMALKPLGTEVSNFFLTHHSDRGAQYCCKEYIEILKNNDIAISMTEDGDPRKNAIAERINGIIKQEYLDHYKVRNLNEARELLLETVVLYNEQRPHLSCAMHVPETIHLQKAPAKRVWKTHYRKQQDISKLLVFSDRGNDVNLCQD